ncbi:hypothetical protein M8A51_14095 [Schlegelella sp. S2-27]|uniref:SPW repeat-containing protein n=1 Tax=Caldimonas mangrovi TaxID=2944811 RepID=A0ABT0YQF6_9BURK|nr:hypothetical protein [Caldimonas mangrovi]MCM5680654.1 hypothetical protein [Caldimonas mangrovi]
MEGMSPLRSSRAYRWAAGIALITILALVWLSLGVGIIGRDGDPANAAYFAVIAIGLVGAVVARLQPYGMALVLLAMALAQASIAAFAVLGGIGLPWSGPAELILLNGFFVGLFTASAWLFWRAARV